METKAKKRIFIWNLFSIEWRINEYMEELESTTIINIEDMFEIESFWSFAYCIILSIETK